MDARNIDGATPLCEASNSGSVDCVQLLLDHGADVNPSLSLTTPMHEAVVRGKIIYYIKKNKMKHVVHADS